MNEEEDLNTESKNPEEMTPAKVRKDLRWAYAFKKPFIDEAKEDVQFALGKQWDSEDYNKMLNEIKVRPLTINKIRPNLMLLTGIESQNRSDFKAYPEGQEDSIKAEISTALVKNLCKRSDVPYRSSELFESGITSGEAWLEPYIDYTDDPLYGCLRWKKSEYNKFFVQPGSKEYDLSDSRFLIKVSWGKTRDELISLFKDKKNQIKAMESGQIELDESEGSGESQQVKDNYGPTASAFGKGAEDQGKFDLIEYYYKKWVEQWYVADLRLGTLKDEKSEKEAIAYKQLAIEHETAEQQSQAQSALAAGQPVPQVAAPGDSVRIFSRRIPQIWRMCCVGNSDIVLDHATAWSYPRWKTYPAMRFICYWNTEPLDYSDRELAIQGIPRGMKDLNRELNKRRTQELRHLNQSTNTGWLTTSNAFKNPKKVQELGGTPGVHIELREGKTLGDVMRLTPTPLSQGHAQLADERTQEMKESSGINTDLLALHEEKIASGRAIALRQKQGLVMVQKLFDNYAQTKRIIGRFILSQIGDMFSTETAIKVMGQAFIQKNFSVPAMAPVVDPNTGQPVVDPSTGQPAMMPMIDPMTGQPKMKIDENAVKNTFNDVLNDIDLIKYDISVGENISSETLQLANYSLLTEMAQGGVPIPPEVIVEESTLSESTKQKIVSAIKNAQAMAQGAPARGGKESKQ